MILGIKIKHGVLQKAVLIGITLLIGIVCILVIPAMVHYHQKFNGFIALVVVPVGYAVIITALFIFREQFKQNKTFLGGAVDTVKLGFGMGMLLPMCVWLIKIVYPLIIWLTVIFSWLVVHVIHQSLSWVMNI